MDVIRDLEALAPVFGSNGRAIQVGTELLVRMKRKPKVAANDGPVSSQTYSITPRTLDLIEQLLPCYEKRGTVLEQWSRSCRSNFEMIVVHEGCAEKPKRGWIRFV